MKFGIEVSCRAEAVQGDLTVEEDAVRIVRESVEYLGGLDILINNAGSMVERRSLANR